MKISTDETLFLVLLRSKKFKEESAQTCVNIFCKAKLPKNDIMTGYRYHF
jgi:hypothetical protein